MDVREIYLLPGLAADPCELCKSDYSISAGSSSASLPTSSPALLLGSALSGKVSRKLMSRSVRASPPLATAIRNRYESTEMYLPLLTRFGESIYVEIAQ